METEGSPKKKLDENRLSSQALLLITRVFPVFFVNIPGDAVTKYF